MKERRQSARLVDSVTFKITYKNHDIICDTLNIGAHGLLCRINQYIPPMTKISLILILPGGSSAKPSEIQAKGVVVRVEKEPWSDGLHELAIFFTEMSNGHRTLLQSFIQSRLVEREFT